MEELCLENGRPRVSFFDQSAHDTLQKSLDSRMKQLTADGLGTTKPQAQPILKEKGMFSLAKDS